MKTFLIALLTLTTTITIAQTTIIWKGGTPGKETKWDEPRNWDKNRVPDEFSLVVIECYNSGYHSEPIIDSYVEVAYLEIRSTANLTIAKNGQLVVDGAYNYSEGITIYGGNLVNTGLIHLNNLDVAITSAFLKIVQNTGHIFVDGEPLKPSKSSDFAFSKPDQTDQ